MQLWGPQLGCAVMQNCACHKGLRSILCLVRDSSSNFESSAAKFGRKATTVLCCSQAPKVTLCVNGKTMLPLGLLSAQMLNPGPVC